MLNTHVKKKGGICYGKSAEVHSFILSHSIQVDQLRSELMQERSARHDLEMDKSAVERQVPYVHEKPLVHTHSQAQCRSDQ